MIEVTPLDIEKTLDNVHELLVAVLQELSYMSTMEMDHELIGVVNTTAAHTQECGKLYYYSTHKAELEED